MRFDYFESFWNEYQEFFNSIQMNKDILKQVYHYNAETFIPTKKPILMDAFNGQEYEVEIVEDKVNPAKKILVIEPVGERQECYKRLAIDDDYVKIFNLDKDNITIEKYDYKKGNINLKCYDNKTLDFLADNDYLITFDAIRSDKQMKNLHILPDFEISATSKLLKKLPIIETLEEDDKEKYVLNIRLEKGGEPYESYTNNCDINVVYSYFQRVKNGLDLPELLNGKTK